MYFPSEKLRKLFDGQNMNDDHEAGSVSERQKGSEGIAQKSFLVTAETVTISQNTSLSRNITFLLGMAGTLPYLPVWLSHTWLGRTSTSALCQHQHPLYNRSFTIFFFLITSNTIPQMSYFHDQVNFSILSQLFCCSLCRHNFPRLFPPPNYHVSCWSDKSFFREQKQNYRAHQELLFVLYLPHSDSQTAAPMHTCPPWTGTSADLPWGRCCVKR